MSGALFRLGVVSGDKQYPNVQHYIAVGDPSDNVFDFPNGGKLSDINDRRTRGGTSDSQLPLSSEEGGLFGGGLLGSSITQSGSLFCLDDFKLENKPNGYQPGDLLPKGTTNNDAAFYIGAPYAGNTQPTAMPKPDAGYFYHGRCVASSVAVGNMPRLDQDKGSKGGSYYRRRRTLQQEQRSVATIASHSCFLNLCLGGGGFDCIAVYSGTAFAFNADVVKTRKPPNNYYYMPPENIEREPELPPPYIGTIIGGTGAFEGIEGYVHVATIAGTTGPLTRSIVNQPDYYYSPPNKKTLNYQAWFHCSDYYCPFEQGFASSSLVQRHTKITTVHK
jgi:hypothetical protein